MNTSICFRYQMIFTTCRLLFCSVFFIIMLISMTAVCRQTSSEVDSKKVQAIEQKRESRIFNMRDSIEMTQPRYVEPTSLNMDPKVASYSPDGKYVALVTSRAELDSGINRYSVWIYKTDQLLNAAKSGKLLSVDKGNEAFFIETNDYAYVYEGHHQLPVRRFKWIEGSKYLAFIGAVEGDAGDVYIYKMDDKKLQKVTDALGAVEDYSISFSNKTIVYLARNIRKCTVAFPGAEKIGRLAFPAHTGMCNHTAFEQRYPYQRFQIYKTTLGDEKAAAELSGEFTWIPAMPQLTLSPDGRWATVVAAPHSKAPIHWRRFFTTAKGADLWQEVAGVTSDNGLVGEGLSMAPQFLLIDVERGVTNAMFDAPTSYLGYYATSHWSSDSEVVLLTHTFIPGEQRGVTGEEKLHVVEYNVRTGRYRSIWQFRDPILHINDVDFVYTGSSFDGKESLFLERRRGNIDRSRSEVLPREADVVSLRLIKKNWHLHEETVGNIFTSGNWQGNEIIIRQSLNIPPEFYLKDAVSGTEYLLTDLNPHLRAIEVPEAKVVEWVTEDGERWKAGLIKPPNFQKGHRYPLVIQVHCFDEEIFLRDSSDPNETAPFAGRALAGQGFVVLQVSPLSVDNAYRPFRQNFRNDIEFNLAIETIIKVLDKSGVIDPERIGIVGWSAGGRAVLSAITDSNVRFRAAVIADAAPVGPLAYFLSAGWPKNMATWIEEQVGGYPWGKGLPHWIEYNPIYKLDRTTAALRLEAYDRIGVIAWYDVFTMLKRLSKPVEFYAYDGASHAPQNPIQRYNSSQGTIDWMAFWLMNAESSDPTKMEQYEAWRHLRQLGPLNRPNVELRALPR